MQIPQHGHSQQHSQQQQQPPPDIPPLVISASLPTLNSRDHDQTSYHMDHNAVFGPPLTDPTAAHSYGEAVQRPPSSNDVLPSFSHHSGQHAM
jgi:hypothetical protein